MARAIAQRVSDTRAVYDGSGKQRCGRAMERRRWQGEAVRMDISDWRKKIDELDEQIVELISKRAEAAKAIGELKAKTAMPIYEPQREKDVFEHVKKVNPGPLADAELIHVYERVMDVMRTLQRQ